MPTSASSVRGLQRQIALESDDPEGDMRRIDRDEIRQVCRHLVGTVGTVGSLADVIHGDRVAAAEPTP